MHNELVTDTSKIALTTHREGMRRDRHTGHKGSRERERFCCYKQAVSSTEHTLIAVCTFQKGCCVVLMIYFEKKKREGEIKNICEGFGGTERNNRPLDGTLAFLAGAASLEGVF